MICKNCGKEIPDDATVCPECNAELTQEEPKKETKKEKKKVNLKLNPLSAVAMILGVLSLIFGFILVTASFSNGFSRAGIDYLAILPAFVSLGISTYQVFAEGDKKTKFLAFITGCVALFVLIYAFIGCLVFIAG